MKTPKHQKRFVMWVNVYGPPEPYWRGCGTILYKTRAEARSASDLPHLADIYKATVRVEWVEK